MTAATEQRAATRDDLEFLFHLFELALGPYLEQTFGPWNQAEQRAHFFASTKPETHRIIEQDGRAIGCLALRRLPDQVKLDRIFLLPEYQKRGIGARLAREVLAQAHSAGLPVRLRVLRVNPARRLWERLAFVAYGETATHFLMERGP